MGLPPWLIGLGSGKKIGATGVHAMWAFGEPNLCLCGYVKCISIKAQSPRFCYTITALPPPPAPRTHAMPQMPFRDVGDAVIHACTIRIAPMPRRPKNISRQIQTPSHISKTPNQQFLNIDTPPLLVLPIRIFVIWILRDVVPDILRKRDSVVVRVPL